LPSGKAKKKRKNKMNVKPYGSNQTLIGAQGCTVLYSYNTPVALKSPSGKLYQTNHKWSVTTSKHINNFVRDMGGDVTFVPQSVMYDWENSDFA